MPQYQSFPDVHGDSRSLEKLKTLRLPVLTGRSFMDVGCNEGFFCGFARFAGASRVLGLDRSAKYIERARARFPDCEFRCQGWDELPDERFDVILLASALHYAEDQSALLHTLVDRLTPDGVLVLELGLVPSPKSEWVKVTRGIDQRWFPTLAKLREILASHVLKSMALSVPQAGDPIPRYVVHVSRRKPVACLLLQPPAYGKSTLVARLFAPGVKVISGDLQISRIAEGAMDVAQPLRDAAAEDFSRLSIDQAVRRIFEQGQGAALVQTWLDAAHGADFALDGYLPAEYHDQVKQQLVEAGYLPVALDWQRPGQALYDETELQRQADAYFETMRSDRAPLPVEQVPSPLARGFIDHIKIDAKGRLEIRGWARTEDGTLPDALAVRLKGTIVTVDTFDKVARRDVQKHLGTDHGQFGFRMKLNVAGIKTTADLGEEFSVAPVGGRPLPFTSKVARALGRTPADR
jgi:SAM-dependent methyltransferase